MAQKCWTLSVEDQALWNEICRSVTPLCPQCGVSRAPAPVSEEVDTKPKTPPKLEAKDDKSRRRPVQKLTSFVHIPSESVSMDAKLFGRMRQGKLSPEARIDLHGMTLDQAHPSLISFIQSNVHRQKRLVLIITGKGRSGSVPYDRGALRRQVPLWLRAAPITQHILEISEAHLRHGGSGAYYVYLRRAR